ncbi:sensor histidine kinase [Streptomyces sp. NPDC056519]|uniref:sensor histidine kinase n=1 Tax=Streptomyces sp. NPDC056519 TaxID=3345849 RepID=UPI0036A905C2
MRDPVPCKATVRNQNASGVALFNGSPISNKADFLDALLLYGTLALLILVLIALALGWFLAGRMLAPIQRITATARVVAGATLHERVALSGPRDEIRELADSFDGMLHRLDRSFQAQRRFAANASHELRTPLASTRTVLQVAQASPGAYRLEELLHKLLELNGRSTEITESLLTLARADHGQIASDEVDLGAVTREECTQAASQAGQAGVALAVSAGPGPLHGDPVLLRQLVRNLVDNAIRHNHRNGWATVEVDRPDGDAVRLVVSSTGRELTREEADRILEPFFRLDTRQSGPASRPAGHGLGLAIVESIVRSHGGTLRADPLPAGGLVITVMLPAGDRPSAGVARDGVEHGGPRGPAPHAGGRRRRRFPRWSGRRGARCSAEG